MFVKDTWLQKSVIDQVLLENKTLAQLQYLWVIVRLLVDQDKSVYQLRYNDNVSQETISLGKVIEYFWVFDSIAFIFSTESKL